MTSTAGEADTPRGLGFALPPEWDEHGATWTSWPFDDDYWDGQLDAVRRDFTGLVGAVSRFEPVIVNVRDDEVERDARRRLGFAGADMKRIRFNPLPLNDVWFRDNGPIFVRDGQGRVALTDWKFNSWGGKYPPWDLDDAAPAAVAAKLGMRRFEIPWVMEGGAVEMNGRGVCLTTRSCLLSPERNPDLDETGVEDLLKENLGARNVVWLEDGLEGDHTDGHIDTIVRFAADDVILCSTEADEDDPNHLTTKLNLERLQSLRDHDGNPYRVVELPLPARRLEFLGKRLPLTYANFYVGNGFVVVPTYQDANDERALAIVREEFPGRQVIGLNATGLITGGGAFHCVTQQQPVGSVLAPGEPAGAPAAGEAPSAADASESAGMLIAAEATGAGGAPSTEDASAAGDSAAAPKEPNDDAS